MATLEELINRMYDMVQDAKGIPLAGEKCIVERDHMLDMLDELREALPNDLQQAQEIVAKRSEMLASGKREAEAIRRQAEEDARQMVSETEIVVAARRKASEKYRATPIQVVSCAAWQMNYCEDTLKRTEEAVALGLEEVRKVTSALQEHRKVKPNASGSPSRVAAFSYSLRYRHNGNLSPAKRTELARPAQETRRDGHLRFHLL